jgi:hypothetical protein
MYRVCECYRVAMIDDVPLFGDRITSRRYRRASHDTNSFEGKRLCLTLASKGVGCYQQAGLWAPDIRTRDAKPSTAE